MDQLEKYLDKCSEGVLRLLEGGKRRGLEELKNGRGNGSEEQLFRMVAASQKVFLELHRQCMTALRFARAEEVQTLVLDVQCLLYLFSRNVYWTAFAIPESAQAVTFPPPPAYSRHYPGEGPKGAAGKKFSRYFGETVYRMEKTSLPAEQEPEEGRRERLEQMLKAAGSP